MCKVIAMVCLTGLLVACGSHDVIHLSPEAFQQVCKDSETPEPPAPTDTDATNVQQNVISIGMQISVTVGEDSSLNRTYPIPPNCTLDIAAVGRIKVCGLTTDELTGKIKTVLERDYFTHATVTVAIETQASVNNMAPAPGGNPAAPGIIYMLGEIGRPGPMQLPPTEEFTLTKAVIAAGGFSTFARGDHVRVIRYCGTGRKYETFVNVARIMKRGEFEDDLPLRANDWVIVPQKVISFF